MFTHNGASLLQHADPAGGAFFHQGQRRPHVLLRAHRFDGVRCQQRPNLRATLVGESPDVPTEEPCAERIPDALPGGGARFALGTEVHGFVRNGAAADAAVIGVETSRGTVHAPHTVIAAGPWSGVVGAYAGIDVPIAPTIRQKLVIPELPDIDQSAPMTIASAMPRGSGCGA